MQCHKPTVWVNGNLGPCPNIPEHSQGRCSRPTSRAVLAHIAAHICLCGQSLNAATICRSKAAQLHCRGHSRPSGLRLGCGRYYAAVPNQEGNDAAQSRS